MSTRTRINRYNNLMLSFAQCDFDTFKHLWYNLKTRPYKERRYVLSCLWHRRDRWAMDCKGNDFLNGYNTQMFILMQAIRCASRRFDNPNDPEFYYNWLRNTMPWLDKYGENK